MMDTGKTLINQGTVEKKKKWTTAGFVVAMSIIGVSIVVAFIIAPFPANLILFLILSGFAAIFIVDKVKRGKFRVYFVKRAVTDKQVRVVYNDDNEASNEYVIFFGKYENKMFESQYDKVNIGDEYYVMHDGYNNHLLETYKTDEYDLDPTLDIREPEPEDDWN